MAAPAVRYNPSYRGTGELMRGPEMEQAMRSAARKGKAFAEGISPVGPASDPHRGEYKTSFSVSSTRRGGIHHDRAAAYLINNAPHAIFVEVKDGHHVLARTADYIRQAGP